MNPETNPDSPRDVSQTEALLELKRAVISLRNLFHFSTLCGIALSATLFVLLLKQVSVLRRQNNEMVTYINDYNKNFVPMVDNIHTNLVEFARSNPTVNPLVQKYFSTNSAPAARPTP